MCVCVLFDADFSLFCCNVRFCVVEIAGGLGVRVSVKPEYRVTTPVSFLNSMLDRCFGRCFE